MAGDWWWALPGPKRFVRRIADDIEDGRSVIVAVPAPMADGRWGRRLSDARIVKQTDCMSPADVRTSSKPTDVIARQFLPPDVFASGSSVSQLCAEVARTAEDAAASGSRVGLTVAVLECAPDWPAWAQWASFIEMWADASRNKPLASRIAFVAIVGGVAARSLPGERDSLRVRRWDAATDEADMLTYSHLAFAEWQAPALHRRVAAAVATHLAIWDTEVVDALAACRLEDVLRPSPLLKRLGHDRGWSNAELAREATWERGQRGSVGGAGRVHSAALALMGDHAAIDSRVWAGQVGVLLPFVEEMRLEAVQALKGMLRLPWPTAFRAITDERDLEIAHLAEQVDRFRLPLAPALKDALPVLRQVRNTLAHLDVVDAGTLADERLLRIQHGVDHADAAGGGRRQPVSTSSGDAPPGRGPSPASARRS